MSTVEKLPPSELDIYAYLDGELSPQQRIHVIEWLLENPEKGRELFEVQLREDLLRTAMRLAANNDNNSDALGLTKDHFRRWRVRRYSTLMLIFTFAAGIAAAIALASTMMLF